MKSKRKFNAKKTIRSLIYLSLIIVVALVFVNFSKKMFTSSKKMFIASTTNEVALYDKNLKEINNKYRGTEVNIKENKYIEVENVKYYEVNIDKTKAYISEQNLKEKKQETVLETKMFVQTPCSILKDKQDSTIIGLAEKGSPLEILDYDNVNDKGQVNMYKIKKDEVIGFVYAKYLVLDENEAKANYKSDELDAIHSKIKNTYNGGDPLKLDYYPKEKPKFENNIMPEAVYSLYLNSGSNVIKNIDKYIEFAKDTKINTFVVDIKDNGSIGYDSEVMKKLSETSYKYANNTKEEYKEAINKLKDAGFYVIGRITVFKDDYYVKDHPESAIRSKSTNEPLLHQKSYWPSPYSRDVWYYNVELAKEAITEMGFNEINFDYVRFPDKMTTIESSGVVELGNTYNEEKTQAIQRFLQYATDEIHKLNTYVSVDVFGESTNGRYTTAYGQYWPAISNVVDVISGMPYPDHFSNGYYNIEKPWNHPYELMTAWAKEASKRQSETTSPAIVRTWVQAYNVQSWVDKNGIAYESEEIEKQVKALFEQGLKGGYVTWLSSSNLEKYETQKQAFQIDYLKEVNG